MGKITDAPVKQVPIAYFEVPTKGVGGMFLDASGRKVPLGPPLVPDVNVDGLNAMFTYSVDKKTCYVGVIEATNEAYAELEKAGVEITKTRAEIMGVK